MAHKDLNYRSALGQIRGLGSAHKGTQHWWMQRVTAIALVPLGLWLIYALVTIHTYDYAVTLYWLTRPHNALLMLVTVTCGLYHAFLGLHVIIDDYIHHPVTKIILIVTLRIIVSLMALSAFISIITCMGVKP